MASRTLNKLTARQVATLTQTGRHSDGGGLYLRITQQGARSWVFMTSSQGKRTEIGLGGATSLSLSSARRIAADLREAVVTGEDPRAVLHSRSSDARTIPTFGDFAETYIAGVESGWRNEVHRQQWRNSLRDHASALRDVPVDEIDTDAVVEVLRPIWTAKAETAKRVRGRIEKILDAARARGFRPSDAMNPAIWRGHLALMLPAPSRGVRGHHAALPWKDAPVFFARLRERDAMAARCLEFVILTAARSGEALGATWREIDLHAKLWTVPAGRMKAGTEHIVPLSGAAVDLLKRVSPKEPRPDLALFGVGGTARSNMAMSMLLRRMQCRDVTVHGFRSTFRDWAGDATEYPRELIEQALAHTIQNKAERAYRRGTAIERRRELMEAWSEYLTGRSNGQG